MNNNYLASLIVFCLCTRTLLCYSFGGVEDTDMSDLEGARKTIFLLDLLKRISPSEQTDPRSEIRTSHVSKETDDRPYSQYNIGKREFMILPPANEWCRLMGFRKCPYYGS